MVTKKLTAREVAEEIIAPAYTHRMDVTAMPKYRLADDSWLLIRPSGTEPVLRVYAEGPTPDAVKALLQYGEEIAAST